MKSYRRWMAAMMLLVLAATGAVSAQDKPADKPAKDGSKNVIVQRGSDYMFMKGNLNAEQTGERFWVADDSTGYFVASEMLSGDRAVKGAPYSAQAVTESTQTLADGNRIVHRSTASVYRDSEGRTRRDQTIGDAAPYATAVAEPSQVSFINDPVSGVNYVFDSRTKTARKMGFITVNKSPDGKESIITTKSAEGKVITVTRRGPELTPEQSAEAAAKAEIEVHASAGDSLPRINVTSTDGATFNLKTREPKIEKLGKQMIEGVEAEGQRATLTIPAGEIGNEQPISIVSENWYSPELKVTVMTRHSDPRMGETVYKLTNINRAEPPSSLFQVPSDYTVKETMEPGMKYKIEREMTRSRKPADKQEN
jgi:hypothetical protein